VECNLVWNHTRDFKIEQARSSSSIWIHKYDFRPKLHNPKFSCHFIRSILKSFNSSQFAKQWLFAFYFPAMRLVSLKSLEIQLVVLFYSPILIGWEKDAI